MSTGNSIKTEHAGAKNKGRKSGFWGTRWEAKKRTRKLRRLRGKKESRDHDGA